MVVTRTLAPALAAVAVRVHAAVPAVAVALLPEESSVHPAGAASGAEWLEEVATRTTLTVYKNHGSGRARCCKALARAAVATGVDGVFMETHVNPAEALSDKANAIAFASLAGIWKTLKEIHALVR